jgi:organic hydroperoxide reductase OsmC/OhrA
MKILPALSACLSLALLATAPAADDTKEKQQQTQKVLALVKEVQGQQKTIAENQGKIDEKLATIAEALRVARIYSSRGGK